MEHCSLLCLVVSASKRSRPAIILTTSAPFVGLAPQMVLMLLRSRSNALLGIERTSVDSLRCACGSTSLSRGHILLVGPLLSGLRSAVQRFLPRTDRSSEAKLLHGGCFASLHLRRPYLAALEAFFQRCLEPARSSVSPLAPQRPFSRSPASLSDNRSFSSPDPDGGYSTVVDLTGDAPRTERVPRIQPIQLCRVRGDSTLPAEPGFEPAFSDADDYIQPDAPVPQPHGAAVTQPVWDRLYFEVPDPNQRGFETYRA